MNKSLIIVFGFLVFGLQSYAKSPVPTLSVGTSSSGGGYVVVCREQGHISSVDLLDIYESKYAYNLNSWDQGVPTNLQLDYFVDLAKLKLNQTLGKNSEDILFFIDQAQNSLRQLADVAVMVSIHDVNPIIMPKDCDLEQAALYVDDDLLMVDKTLWSHMNTVNQAALILHEGIYRYLREEGDTDSRRTRKFVAHIFSDFAFEAIDDGIPNEAVQCLARSKDLKVKYKFWAYRKMDSNNKRKLQLQFQTVEGKTVFSKKTVVLDYEDMAQTESGNWSSTSMTQSESTSRSQLAKQRYRAIFEPGGLFQIISEVWVGHAASTQTFSVVSSEGEKHVLGGDPECWDMFMSSGEQGPYQPSQIEESYRLEFEGTRNIKL